MPLVRGRDQNSRGRWLEADHEPITSSLTRLEKTGRSSVKCITCAKKETGWSRGASAASRAQQEAELTAALLPFARGPSALVGSYLSVPGSRNQTHIPPASRSTVRIRSS